MRRLAGIEHARRTAARLIDDFGVSRPEHIDIEGFAARIGINIVMGDLDGANAQLVVTPTNVYILVSSRVTDAAVRRFSIAHELGHLVLDHPARPAAELCTPSPVPRDDSTHRDHECEANAFAAELLMPTALMARHALTAPVDMDVVWHIATTFRVSCLAAAIELVRHSREPCAAVFSRRGIVRWAAISAVFPFEIGRGTKVGPGTEAAAFNTTGTITERARTIPVAEWCRALDDTSFEGRATRAFAAYLADTQRDQPPRPRAPHLQAMRGHPGNRIGGGPNSRSSASRSLVATSIRAFATRIHLPIEIEEHAVASREFDTVLSMLWVPPAAQAVLSREEPQARPLGRRDVRPIAANVGPTSEQGATPDVRAIPDHVFGATREHFRTRRHGRGAIPTIPASPTRSASNDSHVGRNDPDDRNDSRPVRGPRDDSGSGHESTAILDDDSDTRTREHTREVH